MRGFDSAAEKWKNDNASSAGAYYERTEPSAPESLSATESKCMSVKVS